MLDDFVTCSEAARIMGVTTGRVRQLLSNGTLLGEKMPGAEHQTHRPWLLLRRDVEQYRDKQSRGRRGRPPGAKDRCPRPRREPA